MCGFIFNGMYKKKQVYNLKFILYERIHVTLITWPRSVWVTLIIPLKPTQWHTAFQNGGRQQLLFRGWYRPPVYAWTEDRVGLDGRTYGVSNRLHCAVSTPISVPCVCLDGRSYGYPIVSIGLNSPLPCIAQQVLSLMSERAKKG